ncbi:MAG: GNAT family N-acetyltransferase [Thermodesulfobacteriota bacterium]
MDNFFGLGSPELLEGVVGLELLGRTALLRSLAVAKGRRKRGLGRALMAKAEGHAKALGIKEL